jgi:hypothetical protein
MDLVVILINFLTVDLFLTFLVLIFLPPRTINKAILSHSDDNKLFIQVSVTTQNSLLYKIQSTNTGV